MNFFVSVFFIPPVMKQRIMRNGFCFFVADDMDNSCAWRFRLYRALLFWMAQDHSLTSEPVFAFSIARNRLDDSVCCQFLQKLRCSGGPEAGHLHHVCPSKYSSVRKSLPHPGNMTGSLGSEYLSNVRFFSG